MAGAVIEARYETSYPPAIVVWPLFTQALRFLQEPYFLSDGVGEEAGSFACGIRLSWTKTDL